MIDQTPYYFAFSKFKGIGPYHFSRLLNVFPTPHAAFTAHVNELTPIIGKLLAEKLRTFRSSFNPIAQYAFLLQKGIQYVHCESSQYPKLLRSISDPPIGLFVVGNTKALNTIPPLPPSSSHPSCAPSLFLSIVGTRRPSDYGEYIAKTFARDLAQYGFTIVSGMAIGIDSFAHQGALEGNGTTIAVLGCGVNNIPSSRVSLYKNIIASGGAVVSEFPPNEYVQKGFFVTRNRIVSGMSNGVLVVEGTDQSGTLITAKYAADQGKDVFAPPVPINSNLSQAPNILLRNGAKLVTCVKDILDEYNVDPRQREYNSLLDDKKGDERVILSLLMTEPLRPDDLSRKSNLTIIVVLTIISMLEIEGIIKKQNDGKYAIFS